MARLRHFSPLPPFTWRLVKAVCQSTPLKHRSVSQAMSVRLWSDFPGGAKSAESSRKFPWTIPNRHRRSLSRRQNGRAASESSKANPKCRHNGDLTQCSSLIALAITK